MNIYTYPSAEAEQRVNDTIKRGLGYTPEQVTAVEDYLKEVELKGDDALVAYTNRFDSEQVTRETLRVSEQEFETALNQVDDAFSKALERAVDQIRSFHERQRENSWIDTPRKGVMLGQMVQPVEAAGVYVPGATGGKTPLVSSVLMGGIPAKVAGVESISLMTPPMADGTVNPYILTAARRVGIDSVFKAGSAWAIAALAYGTQQVPKVDVIVGPGNIWVTLAKKLVSGTVGIDMIAGPSEILIIADENARPDYIAADLLSQAEHDEVASSILVTTSEKLANQVSQSVASQLAALSRKEIASASIERFGTILVTPDMETAVALSNRLAPEHLELMVANPFEWVGQIRNAGAVFMGDYTPEP
ncbi:MAG: histidinol dehydrogenase, partial [Desulfobacteraceae bacterium]